MNELDEAIKEFLVESHENLGQLDLDLILLEKDPSATHTLASVFRTLHTIKGSCGFLGLQKLEAVAHAGENLLNRLRQRELELTPEIITTMLGTVDTIRGILADVEATGTDGDRDHSRLIELLAMISEGKAPESVIEIVETLRAAVPPSAPTPAADASPPELAKTLVGVSPLGSTPHEHASPRERSAMFDDSFTLGDFDVAGEAATADTPPGIERPARPPISQDATIFMQPQQPARPAAPPPVAPLEPRPNTPEPPAATQVSDATIRINIDVLDTLMNLVSELVLARNQIMQYTTRTGEPVLLGAARQLNLITTELQESVMKTRMQPIGNIWNMFPRVVRDIAHSCGKRVRLEMDGRETELDKSLIEAIKDPLTHLVRNAVDHGIEPPDVRQAAGKRAEGLVFLRAFHEGGQVNIEICDDGAGIDTQRIRQRAIARDLVSAEQAAQMGSETLLNLIFLPGFSTTDRVTSVSGRGVGMDVVKTNIERIGGTVDVQSKLGEGTSIKMRIPLTLAIIRALIVTSGREQFAIPQVNMLELVRLEGDKARRGIEHIHDAPVYRYRGKLLPIVYLNRELRLDGDGRANDDVINLVVLQADDRQFGLVVDHINDTQEIVVKPLAMQLKGVACYAGATIMGDGRVALILDVLGLAQRAGVVQKMRDLALLDTQPHAPKRSEDRQTLLVVDSAEQGRMAIPLSQVSRLEEFPRTAVECVGGRQVVQYRGQIMPLLDVSAALSKRPQPAHPAERRVGTADRDVIHVVVYSDGRRSVGLVVDRILDIVEESLAVKGRASRDNVLCTTVLQGRVTELLDLQSIIQTGDAYAAVEG